MFGDLDEFFTGVFATSSGADHDILSSHAKPLIILRAVGAKGSPGWFPPDSDAAVFSSCPG